MFSPDAILLNWLLALPFFTALGAAVFPRFALRPHSEAEAESLPRAPFSLGALACFMGALIAASLLPAALRGSSAAADYWWTSGLYQFRFRADGLAAPVVCAIYLVGLLVNLHYYSLPTPTAPHRRAALLLLSIGAASAAVLSADLVAIMFFLQLLLVSVWLLASVDAPGEADRMLGLTFLGGLLILGGTLLIWKQVAGTAVSGVSLALFGAAPHTLRLVGLVTLLGVTPLVAAVPGHFWLPRLARAAPRAAFACSVLLTLVGFATVLRLLPGVLVLPLVPGLARLSLALGLVSLLSGAVAAWIARSLREVAGWLTVAQAGQFLLALSLAASPAEYPAGLALQAATVHALTAPLALVALWSAMSTVLSRTGTEALPGLSGLLGTMPFAGIALLAGGLSLSGVPPLPGFWGQRLLVSAMIADHRRLLVITLVLADLLILAVVVGAFRRAFLRGEPPPPVAPARRWESMQLLLAAMIVALSGVLLGLLGGWTESIVKNVLTLSP
jgi:formate hydrogenlyase subunit 3/multisubunit Na+/H+ antiporter MnhD subunit